MAKCPKMYSVSRVTFVKLAIYVLILSHQLFMYWEVNTFAAQFSFLHASLLQGCHHKGVRTSSAVPRQHIFYCSAEKRYVQQFSNMTCTKREDIMLRIFTNDIATFNRVLHGLFIISFVYLNYVLCVRLDLVKSGLLECPTAFLHLVTIHQPREFRRKMKSPNAYDRHPNNTLSKFLVSLTIYRSIMPLNLLSVWSPQKNRQLYLYFCTDFRVGAAIISRVLSLVNVVVDRAHSHDQISRSDPFVLQSHISCGMERKVFGKQ